ncbi:MAG: arsenic efflux protein [Oscillospiraceae bacterium]|nr:arsenic efflux protein [Oscillospiraceae bacterium]
MLTDILLDAVFDTLKTVPFLFLAYLLMELIEYKFEDKAAEIVNRAGRSGPVLGGLLGIIPQCGFSAATANLFSGGLISRGTMLAVFLSTSDEMLPMLISEHAPAASTVKVMLVKIAVAIVAGLVIDLTPAAHRSPRIHELCEEEHCDCEDSIWVSALKHTGKITIFIFLVNLVLTAAITFLGADSLSGLVFHLPFVGELLTAVIGLIPNCAASVAITELYLQGGMSTGAMLSGLLTGSGIGLLVLFRMNRDWKDNLKTLGFLYAAGVLLGFLAGLLPIF